MQEVFKDLVVIELASVLAGPSVGMFFRELGARVIKIENKKRGGDVTRKWKTPNEETPETESAYFYSINWKKEHVFLDLTDSNDYAKLVNYVSECDIVISNYLLDTAQKLKISAIDLAKYNTKMIYAQIYASSENKNKPGFDITIQAESGFLSMCGTQKGVTTKIPVALMDILTAHQLKEGILIAMIKQARTGKSYYVETSLIGSAIASLANQATNYLINGLIPKKMGTLHPNIAPYGDIFFTKDKRELLFACGNDAQFYDLMRSLGLIDRIQVYKDNQARLKHRDSLQIEIQHKVGDLDSTDLSKLMNHHKVPFAFINDVKTALTSQVGASMILSEYHPESSFESQRVSTQSFTISDL